MSKQRILQILEQNKGRYFSGEELARQVGVTRAAVWKSIRALQEEGYQIQSKPGSGYCLDAQTDLLLEEKIRRHLHTRRLGQDLRLYPVVDSTNTQLRVQAYEGAPEGAVLAADQQTAGRGRLGRSFHSPNRNGVYMSLLLRPQLPFERIHFLTMLAAVSVTEAISSLTGLSPQIKWVNDVLLDGRKLCGILSEAAVEGESGRLSFVVVGIGVNVVSTRDFPELSGNRAGALGDFADQPLSRCRLIAEILNRFEQYYYLYLETQDPSPFLQKYREALCLLGQRVTVSRGTEQYPALVLDLSAQGGLIVRREDGTLSELTSGEVSIRL